MGTVEAELGEMRFGDGETRPWARTDPSLAAGKHKGRDSLGSLQKECTPANLKTHFGHLASRTPKIINLCYFKTLNSL